MTRNPWFMLSGAALLGAPRQTSFFRSNSGGSLR